MPVSDAALRAALERVLGAPVDGLDRSPWPYRSSFPMEELSVGVDGRPPARMLFKDLSADALPPAAAVAKPRFLLDGGREVEAYRHVLGAAAVDAPACYGVVADPDGARSWIFLELIDGRPLWQVGEIEAWEAAARSLAALHAEAPGPRAQRLLRHDAALFRRWPVRALEFAPGKPLERIAASYERVVRRLARWPVSLVHGEFYPSNVLVQPGSRIRAVDWETAGVGPGLLDLAALSSGAWSTEGRERLARAYFDAAPARLRGSGWDDFTDALGHCRLHLAVQWLGWSREWTPPAEHEHDWLSEATQLAQELQL